MWPAVKWRELWVFLVVAEELHFGRAADRLLITPSRVSQIIRGLEAKTGAQLFERTSRRVRLTPVGERLRSALEPLCHQLLEALNGTRQAATGSGGLPRISARINATAWTTVDLREIRVFLTIADELHFGGTAARLGITHARVSQMVRMLEAKVGARLFERTSRHVRLTHLGSALQARLGPLYAQVLAVVDSVAAGTREARGTLRLGVTATTDRPSLDRLVRRFRAAHPDCDLSLTEVDIWEPYGPLRSGKIDVLYNWLAVEEPDLTVGPVIEMCERVCALGAGHRLASQTSVTTVDLVGERVNRPPSRYPRALADAILVRHASSGQPLRRTERELESLPEVAGLIASGEIVSINVRGLSRFVRDDIVLVPVVDLPPIPLGLVWCTAHENARIRALASVGAAGEGAGELAG